MSENKSAKRRLDVGSSEEVEASTKKHVKVVKNPYLKKSSQTTTAKTEEASDSFYKHRCSCDNNHSRDGHREVLCTKKISWR